MTPVGSAISLTQRMYFNLNCLKHAFKQSKHRGLYLLLITLVVITYFSGGILEGRINPVVIPTQITDTKEEGFSTAFWVTFEKKRDCSFDHIVWEWPTLNGVEPIPVKLEFLEPSKIRLPGKETFGEWRIWLTTTDLLTNSRAYVYHKCHSLWLTKTLFWDGLNSN